MAIALKNEKVLSERQIASIYKSIGLVFSEEINEEISINLIEFKRQIRLILNQMKFEKKELNQYKGHRIVNLNPRRQALAMRGYLLIFKFREYLLNEEINYRYYYQDNEGNVKATTFTEKDIAKYVKFGDEGIKIDPSKARYAEVAQDYQKNMDKFFKKYTVPDKNSYMQIAGKGYGRVVRSNIMRTYEHLNPGLRTKEGRYQMFNRGHIYEAIDTSLSLAISKNQTPQDKIIESYVFGKYLALDNIRASQGGDNPITNTSIKSNQADLYDFATIKTQLENILIILENGPKSVEQIQSIIEKLYLHKSKFIDEEDFQKTARMATEKILKDFEQQIKILTK